MDKDKLHTSEVSNLNINIDTVLETQFIYVENSRGVSGRTMPFSICKHTRAGVSSLIQPRQKAGIENCKNCGGCRYIVNC